MILSIIIPVLNVEKYVKQCVLSLVKSNLPDCEIILVLGKSTDSSNEICLELEKEYSIVKICFQNGKGLSNARNDGFNLCKGKYVIYIDSDDFVHSANFSKILEVLRGEKQFDVLVTNFNRILTGSPNQNAVEHIYQIEPSDSIIEGMEYLPHMLTKKQCFWNVWRYVYRKEFLLQNKIIFLENRLSEDVDYTTQVFLANPKMLFWHNPFYYYRVNRTDSLMGQVTLKRLDDTITTLHAGISSMADSHFPYAALIIHQYQFELFLNMAQICELDKKNRLQAKQLFLLHKQAFLAGDSNFYYLLAKCLHLKTIVLFSYLLYFAKRAKRKIRKNKGKRRDSFSSEYEIYF